MVNNSTIERIKEIPIKEFIEDFLHWDVKRGSILCPLPTHNDTHYGNCIIDQRKNICTCYACKKRFDNIDLYTASTGKDWKTSVREIADYYGIAVESGESRPTDFVIVEEDDLRVCGINDVDSYKELFRSDRNAFFDYTVKMSYRMDFLYKSKTGKISVGVDEAIKNRLAKLKKFRSWLYDNKEKIMKPSSELKVRRADI